MSRQQAVFKGSDFLATVDVRSRSHTCCFCTCLKHCDNIRRFISKRNWCQKSWLLRSRMILRLYDNKKPLESVAQRFSASRFSVFTSDNDLSSTHSKFKTVKLKNNFIFTSTIIRCCVTLLSKQVFRVYEP